ncbi:metallophosphoesterase [Candidatus Bipolaricaulota bacterium]|nr:metallophosphoesterase [Candidatus Bipolaricaulota bacterium]
MSATRRPGNWMRDCALLSLLLFGLFALSGFGAEDIVHIGLITDTHAHDLDSPSEGKWMSHTEERLSAFTTTMNEWGPDFVIELGDFINGWVVFGTLPGDPARIPDILAWADGLYDQFDGPAYHVVGNHDLYNLDKTLYLDILGIDATYYSFDVGAYHFIVLDVQYAEDGSDLAHTYTGVAGFVPEPEFEWLRADLEAAERPTIVFVHQMLDDFIEEWGRPTVINQSQLQQLFAEDGDVIAVFQGHDHDNVHNVIDGIHYVTFEAMVDQDTPPTWAQISLDPGSRSIVIEGFGVQASYELSYSGRE